MENCILSNFTISKNYFINYTIHFTTHPTFQFLFSYYLYILREFKKLVITFFLVKNIPKLINQQLKNRVKIVNWQKKVSYCFFYCQKYPYLKLKNGVKIIISQK